MLMHIALILLLVMKMKCILVHCSSSLSSHLWFFLISDKPAVSAEYPEGAAHQAQGLAQQRDCQSQVWIQATSTYVQ